MTDRDTSLLSNIASVLTDAQTAEQLEDGIEMLTGDGSDLADVAAALGIGLAEGRRFHVVNDRENWNPENDQPTIIAHELRDSDAVRGVRFVFDVPPEQVDPFLGPGEVLFRYGRGRETIHDLPFEPDHIDWESSPGSEIARLTVRPERGGEDD